MNMHLTADQKTIAQQRVRIEELEEEIRQMKEDLAPVVLFPRGWGLTPSQQRLVMALYRAAGPMPQRQLALAMDSKSDDPEGLVDVVIGKVRRKLSPLGVSIANQWGIGFEMTAESKVIVRAALAGSVSA